MATGDPALESRNVAVKSKRKRRARGSSLLPPPEEKPLYTTAPLITAEMADMEQWKEDYGSDYGEFLYDPEQAEESDWGDCETDSEKVDDDADDGYDYTGPESLEDEDLLRVLHEVLRILRAREENGDDTHQTSSFEPSSSRPLNPLEQAIEPRDISAPPLTTLERAIGTVDGPPTLPPLAQAEANAVLPSAPSPELTSHQSTVDTAPAPSTSAVSTVAPHPTEVTSRLRPKSSLRLTQKAQKLYRA